MPAWLPVLKVVLPYVATVATTAIPAFTQKRDGAKSAELMAQQISELQEAAGQNAESLHILAEQIQTVVNAIETGARENEAALKQARLTARLAIAVAVAALLLAAYALL